MIYLLVSFQIDETPDVPRWSWHFLTWYLALDPLWLAFWPNKHRSKLLLEPDYQYVRRVLEDAESWMDSKNW